MKNPILLKRLRRKRSVSSKIHGTAKRPRVSVHRSNKYIYAQVIDDDKAHTLVACNSKLFKTKGTKLEEAKEVGKQLAELLKKHKVTMVVFDRGGYAYNGRVKALAEGLRANSITV